MAAIRDKTSYLAAFFRRISARRGGKRALVAVMHKLAIAIWHVLRARPPTATSAPSTSPNAIPNAPCAA